MDYGVIDQIARDSAPGCLSIDLEALRDNYLSLQQLMAPVKTAAVVKADAYGLGVARIAPILYDAGCRDFFVAQFGEALKLRPILQRTPGIFVLNGLQPGSEASCAAQRDRSGPQLAGAGGELAQSGELKSTNLPAVLQFDTGMSRLGLSPQERGELAEDPASRPDRSSLS